MGKQYSHLSSEERAVLQIDITNGASIRSISRRLGRSVSTLSRELSREQGPVYVATKAAMDYRLRRQNCVRKRRLVEGGALFQSVRDDLVFQRWSPQQIAAKRKVMHPDDPTQRVSHETIYAAIYAYPRGGLKKELVEALRQRKPARGRRRTTATKRSWVPEQLRIIHRPEEIEQRLIPGHWEGDLIKGAFN
ncbi:IS30 family transposase, partial [Xanthomonas vasicola]